MYERILRRTVPPDTAKKAANKLAKVKATGGKNASLSVIHGAHGVSRLITTVRVPAPKNVNKLMRNIVLKLDLTAKMDVANTSSIHLLQFIMCCFFQ